MSLQQQQQAAPSIPTRRLSTHTTTQLSTVPRHDHEDAQLRHGNSGSTTDHDIQSNVHPLTKRGGWGEGTTFNTSNNNINNNNNNNSNTPDNNNVPRYGR